MARPNPSIVGSQRNLLYDHLTSDVNSFNWGSDGSPKHGTSKNMGIPPANEWSSKIPNLSCRHPHVGSNAARRTTALGGLRTAWQVQDFLLAPPVKPFQASI